MEGTTEDTKKKGEEKGGSTNGRHGKLERTEPTRRETNGENYIQETDGKNTKLQQVRKDEQPAGRESDGRG